MGNALETPLAQIPSPQAISQHIARLYRELALSRRLLRLSQSLQAEKHGRAEQQEASHA